MRIVINLFEKNKLIILYIYIYKTIWMCLIFTMDGRANKGHRE